MDKGDEILATALSVWSGYDSIYEHFYQVMEAGTGENFGRTRHHLHAAIESWTSEQRLEMIKLHLDAQCGGLDNAGPADVAPFEVAVPRLLQINGIVGFYKVPRAFIHLYVHAHLFKALELQGPLDLLDDFIDALSPQ